MHGKKNMKSLPGLTAPPSTVQKVPFAKFSNI